jgi:type I restriction enzyme S subunit
MTNWKPTKLADVLTPVSRPEKLDPTTEYRLLGVRLDGAGPFLRETKLGSQTPASTLSRVEAGDFIYSRLFAWRGAFGIISEDLDGCHVSGEFPTFTANPGKLDPKFLRYWFRRPTTLETVLADCTGSTPLTRNRFKEEFFLALEIPLPPVTEQRRIVARIEQLAAQIEEARRLRHQATEETETLVLSAARHVRQTGKWKTRPIAECSKMSTGTTPPSHREDYYGGDMQWYTPGDLEFRSQLGRSTRTISDAAVAEGKARIFDPGTVLLVAIGGSLRKVALTHERCSSNQQITGIKLSSDYLPEFGFWWMRGLYHELRDAAPQATLPIINQRRIGAFEIAVLPESEQRRIVGYLDGLAGQVAAA